MLPRILIKMVRIGAEEKLAGQRCIFVSGHMGPYLVTITVGLIIIPKHPARRHNWSRIMEWNQQKARAASGKGSRARPSFIRLFQKEGE